MRVIVMKKTYKKPVLFFEDFTLMEAITSSCAIGAQHENKYTCAWWNEDFGMYIYDTVQVSSCQIDEIAYGVPQDVVFPS